MIEQRSLGRLTLERELDNDLLLVRCNCEQRTTTVEEFDGTIKTAPWVKTSYPFLVHRDTWEAGEILGCAHCDPIEKQQRNTELEQEAKAQQEQLAAQEDRKQRYAKFVHPHMEDVSAAGMKLLRLMAQSRQPWNLDSMIRQLDKDKSEYGPPTTKAQAWDALTSLIACNLVLEFPVATREVREMSEWEYYSEQCLPSSSYALRACTRKILEEMDQAAEVAEAERLEAVKAGQIKEHLREWITARCTVAPKESASRILLMDSYVKWAKSEGKEPLDSADYNDHMAKAGFNLTDSKWLGVRLKTVQESLEFQKVADLPLAVDLTAVPPITIESELRYHN